MICRKCRQPMLGPRWYEPTNSLVYTCLCGFKETVPAMDQHTPTNKELAVWLKSMGLPSSILKDSKETP